MSNPDHRSKIVRAIAEADAAFGFSIKLIRLNEGVAVHRLEMDEGVSEHPSHGDALELAMSRRDQARADAIILALRGEGEPVAWGLFNPYTSQLRSATYRDASAAKAQAEKLTNNYPLLVAVPLFYAAPPASQALAGPPKPEGHKRHPYCQPGDESDRVWMLTFSDPDLRTMVFTGEEAETDAVEAWNRYNPAYNCYLFATVDRVAPAEAHARVEALEALAARWIEMAQRTPYEPGKEGAGRRYALTQCARDVRALLSGSSPKPARVEARTSAMVSARSQAENAAFNLRQPGRLAMPDGAARAFDSIAETLTAALSGDA